MPDVPGCLGTLVRSPPWLTLCLPVPLAGGRLGLTTRHNVVTSGQIWDSVWVGTEDHSSVAARTSDCPVAKIRNSMGLPRVVFHRRQAARCWVGQAWLVLEGELPTGPGIHSSLSVLVSDARSLAPKTLRERACRNTKTSAGLCPSTEPRPMVKSP